MHLIVRRRWKAFTSSSWRLRASRVVVLMYSGVLAVQGLASNRKMLLAECRRGLSRRTNSVSRVICRRPVALEAGIRIDATWCLRTLGTARVDTGNTRAQIFTGSWRRGQNAGRRRNAAIGEGTVMGRIRRMIGIANRVGIARVVKRVRLVACRKRVEGLSGHTWYINIRRWQSESRQ
jgi:hypothetical protein